MLKNFPTSPAKVIFLLALIVIGAQAFTGETGILSWRQYKLRADLLEIQKQELAKKHEALEKQIKLLKGATANRDFIEEKAILNLDYVSPKDKVIILPN